MSLKPAWKATSWLLTPIVSLSPGTLFVRTGCNSTSPGLVTICCAFHPENGDWCFLGVCWVGDLSVKAQMGKLRHDTHPWGLLLSSLGQ